MKIEMELSNEEAQEVLFALKMRACQKPLHPQLARSAEDLRARFNRVFEKEGGWDTDPDRFSAKANDIRVTIQTRHRW